MHANASRHSALSYGHAKKLEVQLQMEVDELLARTEEAPRRSPGLRRDGDAIQIKDTTGSPRHRVSGGDDADQVERIGTGQRH